VCRHPYLNNHASQFVPLYAYEFADRRAPWYFPPVNFDHGAAHTIDIQFLFLDWHGGPLGIPHRLTPEERKLSGQLVAAWTNFMYSGNPNLKGNRPWPRYTKGSEVYLSEDVTGLSPISSAQFNAAHNCAFWDTILIYETPSKS
jgi:para-nitrobenzyl esterase